MNQMKIFKNPEFGNVRVIDEDGKYLFCGTDVARALGYSIPSKAVNTHCKGVSKMEAPTNGGVQKLLFIPEGDVYRLIVHSKLPSAERFERWVFDEVLPSIRQHGAYLTREKLWEVATSPEALLKLCSDLLAEREKNAALQADNARLQGKAVYERRGPIYPPQPPRWGHWRTKRTISIKKLKKEEGRNQAPGNRAAIIRLLYAYEP